ncbi:MAG TPA: DJ-1/PfpI family protein [Candidatus Binataceae bacterium]|nr:DJ-1/PfpI family protein [Candidatus Binataceae bacterium]
MAEQRRIGAVLFEGFELLDVFGPLEAWGMLAMQGQCSIATVAEKAGIIASVQGPKAIAEFGFGDCPALDVILIPGGFGTRKEVENQILLEWLKSRAEKAEIVSSVCTGSGILARTGLLDGRRATTNKLVFSWVASLGPAVNWVKEARWAEDGKFVTSSGVSAGIDMSLALIARLYGMETAEKTAVRMEYEWHRDAGWDPFAKIHGLA